MTLKIDLSPFITAEGNVSQRRGEYPQVEPDSIEVWLYVQDAGLESDAYNITNKMSFGDKKIIEAKLVEKFQSQTIDFDDDTAYDWHKAEGLI